MLGTISAQPVYSMFESGLRCNGERQHKHLAEVLAARVPDRLPSILERVPTAAVGQIDIDIDTGYEQQARRARPGPHFTLRSQEISETQKPSGSRSPALPPVLLAEMRSGCLAWLPEWG